MGDGLPESLYPERETVECHRCRCQHWKDGRCFAQDPVGWPIMRPIVFPHIKRWAERIEPEQTKGPWWS